ncbi:nitrilase-related carbon-nitrogen hydrolase [Bacillus norwichensis]|uniref:Carbon-nitrogen hydrolase n=1 Tax=Bacillus norwichensis TaxID=2762217 RepID=A0ABR8VNI0_9BACI|nr:nitrilase-related carbon-nitrogen hydrolase [Bacillus norwichensis]MBD8006320.1 carbon-nitrogen hydrolase [Bacillus norwichensis]
MNSRRVNIGIIQFDSKLGDVEYNVKKAAEKITLAAEKGANIVCLPELFSTGYNLDLLGDDISLLALHYYDDTVEKMAEAARENNVYIVAPFGEKRDLEGILYNSALVFDDEGNLLGSFAKTHLWAKERMYFKEGSDYPIFDTKYGKFGIAICYDIGFPEACRSLCLNGAEFVFMPSAWRVQDKDMWELNVPQRALENIFFTIGVNRFGHEGDLYLFGGSKVCNPRGQVIAQLPEGEETVEVVTIDLNEINTFRTQISYLRDRKPDIYN